MAHAEDLVYLQFSESGAMGWAGDVILGALEDGALISQRHPMAGVDQSPFYEYIPAP